MEHTLCVQHVHAHFVCTTCSFDCLLTVGAYRCAVQALRVGAHPRVPRPWCLLGKKLAHAWRAGSLALSTVSNDASDARVWLWPLRLPGVRIVVERGARGGVQLRGPLRGQRVPM